MIMGGNLALLLTVSNSYVGFNEAAHDHGRKCRPRVREDPHWRRFNEAAHDHGRKYLR